MTETPGPGEGADRIRWAAPEEWSRESVERLVTGRTIFVRNEIAHTVAAPAWLAAAAAACDERSSDDLMATVHTADRHVITDAFLACLARPGEPAWFMARACQSGSWQHHRACWLNLLDSPGMGFVLLMTEIVAGPPIEPPEPDDDDEHFAVADWMYLRHAPGGLILAAEGKVKEILGYEPDELVGRYATDFISPASMASAVAAYMHINSSPGATGTRRHQLRRKDGTDVWTESTLISLRRPGGGTEIMRICWDITDKLAAEKAVAQSREQLRLLAEQVPAGVFLCDGNGCITFHNGRWTDMGLAAGIGDPLHLIAHPDARAAVATAVRQLIDEDGTGETTVTTRSPDGERYFVLSLRSDGEPDRARRMVIGSVEDVTATERLRREARVDPLTGLINRLALVEHLTDVLTRHPSSTLVTFVDLDGFKEVNDTHGHDAGDAVLRVVAERLAAAVRPDDAVSRYGGDEFVIVCENLSPESAVLLPDRIETALADKITFPGGTWQPAASIGSVWPASGDDPAAVLRRADLAMYETKRTRRSRA